MFQSFTLFVGRLARFCFYRGMKKREGLIFTALTTGSPITFDAEQLPRRIKLLHWGENITPEGPVIFNQESVAALSAQIDRDTFKRVVLDFEHQSVPGHPNYQPPPRHNAAHGDLEIVPNDGVWLTEIKWTPKGHEHGRDYCDVSPVIVHRKRTRPGEPVVVLGVLSAALCDNGNVRGITAFSASYKGNELETEKEKDMEEMQKQLDAQKALLEEQAKKIQALEERLTALEEKLKPVAEAEITAESAAQIKALAADYANEDKGLQVSALSARIEAMRKEHMIQMAVLQGKAVNLDEAAVSAMSAESLASHISGLGVTLPVFRTTKIGGQEPLATTALSAEIETLLATIKAERNLPNIMDAWPIAKARRPDLFTSVKK